MGLIYSTKQGWKEVSGLVEESFLTFKRADIHDVFGDFQIAEVFVLAIMDCKVVNVDESVFEVNPEFSGC